MVRRLAEFALILSFWNQRGCVLPVTDYKATSAELRALVSAANASALWDLRCAVREQLVAYLQARYPGSLPRTRAVLQKMGPA